MKALIAVLILVAGLAAQQIEVKDGQVWHSLPLPAGAAFTYDFSIFQNVAGTATNNFSFKEPRTQGPFVLNYTGQYGCLSGCHFTGTFTQWYTPISIPFGCVIYAAELTGTFTNDYKTFSDVPAFYTQAFCDSNGAYRWGAGDFSLNVGDNSETRQ